LPESILHEHDAQHDDQGNRYAGRARLTEPLKTRGDVSGSCACSFPIVKSSNVLVSLCFKTFPYALMRFFLRSRLHVTINSIPVFDDCIVELRFDEVCFHVFSPDVLLMSVL